MNAGPQKLELEVWRAVRLVLQTAGGSRKGTLADLPLLGLAATTESSRQGETTLRSRLSNALSPLEARVLELTPLPHDNYADQAVLCWCLHVQTHRPIKAVGRHVGYSRNGFVIDDWGDKERTVRERMWVSANAPRGATVEAWPGIREVIEAVVGEFELPLLDDRLAIVSPDVPNAQPGVRLEFAGAPGTLEALREVRAGQRDTTLLTDFALTDWRIHLATDDSGMTVQTGRVKILNNSSHAQPSISLPIFAEGLTEPPVVAVRFKRRRLTITAAPWAPDVGGFFEAPFPTPLRPGKPQTLEYEFIADRSPVADQPGWFEWIFARQQRNLVLQWDFADVWTVSHLRHAAGGGRRFAPAPELRDRSIFWRIKDPVNATRYRLDFELTYHAHA